MIYEVGRVDKDGPFTVQQQGVVIRVVVARGVEALMLGRLFL